MPSDSSTPVEPGAVPPIPTPVEAEPTAPKPKRVRTGCLTCRERHLKCDEGLPDCLNCKKSGKVCKRGVKLNFHWLDVRDPAVVLRSGEWSVQFQDESRLIASEYKGGLRQYSSIEAQSSATITPPTEPAPESFKPVDEAPGYPMTFDFRQSNLPPLIKPGAPGLYPEGGRHDHQAHSRDTPMHHSQASASVYLPTAPASLQYENPQRVLTPRNDAREFLSDPQEVLYLQVFVEEVGIWMDSMDFSKQFSRLLPFQSLSDPMLHNAFLSCGARHLCLMAPQMWSEEKAVGYYDTATSQLMQQLHDPDRDTVLCALTATVLNVYEIMCERAMQRMNHIAGARALIKECGWSARSGGVGSACFWLNVGMEVLSCLHFNWQTAWDPDLWGVDLDFDNVIYQEPGGGNEELWVHRILWVTAKICNFRATMPRFREKSEREEERRVQRRVQEWSELRNWCERWEQNCPRTMRPLGVLWPGQSTGPAARKSLFPEIWLLQRASITARLFYHTCMTLLSSTHPLYPAIPASSSPSNHHLPPSSAPYPTNTYTHSSHPSASAELALQSLHHARQTCGIVAHVKDRGVASVSLRSMAIAAEVLVERKEQEEVMGILKQIRKDTGWNITFLEKELPEYWGWNASKPEAEFGVSSKGSGGWTQGQGQQGYSQASGPGTPKILKGGMVNPLLAKADFLLPNHPYQNFYLPPRLNDNMGGVGNGMGHNVMGNNGMSHGGGMSGFQGQFY